MAVFIVAADLCSQLAGLPAISATSLGASPPPGTQKQFGTRSDPTPHWAYTVWLRASQSHWEAMERGAETQREERGSSQESQAAPQIQDQAMPAFL